MEQLEVVNDMEPHDDGIGPEKASFSGRSFLAMQRLADYMRIVVDKNEFVKLSDRYGYLARLQSLALASSLKADAEAGGSERERTPEEARFETEFAAYAPGMAAAAGIEPAPYDNDEDGNRYEEDSAGGGGGGGASPSDSQMEEFQRTVNAWYQLDDEERAAAERIAQMRKQVREKQELKRRLSDAIMAFMERFGIDDLTTSKGVLRYHRRDVRKGASKKLILERLRERLGDEAEELVGTVSAPETVERRSLRRLNR